MSIEVADLVASLRADDSGFSHSMDVAGEAVGGLHHNTDSALGSIKALGLGLGALSAGALVSAVKQASDFSTMMVHLQSNTGVTTAELGNMSAGIKALAASSGAPLDQLSEGIMRIHNSGFSAADALKILKPAMESALSTGDDVGKVASALGVAMHEFHIGTDQATQSMNLLHTAAQLGNSTLGEFADGTTKALNLAGGFGLKLVDVAAALSTLTQSGQTARNASDGLSAAMSGFVKPTTAAMTMVQTLSKETGVNLVADFSAAGLKSRGLANAIGDVHLAIAKMGGETATQRKTLSDYADQLTATGNITDAQFTAKMTAMANKIHDPTAALLQLFPNIRAFREMMLLTGSQADAFGKNLGTLGDVMSGKLDPTTQGFAAQQATLAAQMAKLQTNVQILAINLGTILLPPLTALVAQVTPIVQQFADWAGKNQSLVIGVLAAGAAIGGLTVAALGLGAAVEVATGPIGLLAAAGAALYLAWQHNLGGIQGIVANMWNQVKPVLTEMQAAFQAGGVSGLAGKIQSSLAGIDWAGLGQTIARNVQQWGAALVGWVAPRLPAVIAALGNVASSVVTYIRGAAPVIEAQMLAWGQAVWSWVQRSAPVLLAQLRTWGAALVGWVQPQIGPLVATLGGLLSRLGSWIVNDALPVVVAHLEAWGGAFLGWVQPQIQPLIAKAGDLLGQFGNWITGPAAKAVGNKLTEWGNAFVAWVVPAMTKFLHDWPGHLNAFLTQIHNDAITIAGRLGAWVDAFVNWAKVNNVPQKLGTALLAVSGAVVLFIGETVGTIATNLGMWAVQFWNWLDPVGTFAALGPSFNKLTDSIEHWLETDALKTIGTGLKTLAVAFWNWLDAKNSFDKLTPSLKLLWSSIEGAISAAAGTAKTAMFNMGKDMAQGFINGVKSLPGAIKDSAENLIGGWLDAAAKKAGVKSPSTVMYQYGVWTVQGYVNGVLAEAQSAWDAAKTVVQGTILTWGQTLAAGAPTMVAAVRDVWLQAWKPETLIGDMQAAWDSASVAGLMQGIITKGLGGQSWGGTFQGSTWGDALTKAGNQAASTATPSIQAAHAGLARAAVTALAGGITSGAGAIAQATTAAMSQAAQAARASLAEFTAVSAEAAQRLKNLAATGNTSGVVAGTQASAAQHVDQSGITPTVSNADQIRANFAAMTGTTQAVAANTASTASALATSLAMLKDQTILLPDMLKQLTDAKTTQDLTNAVQAAHTSLLNQENDARAQGNNALLASLQGQQQALGIQQQVETSLINQVNAAQTLADKANQTLATDQQRLSTLQQQEDAADQALDTARQNLQTVQDTLKTQQDQLNLKLAYDPSHAAQQGQLDAMAVDHAKTVLSLDSQIQAAKDGHNSRLVTQLTNQKSLLDTQYSDQRGVIEALAQQSNNAYQSQQTQLSDMQQQQSINNQLKTAQDKVAAAAKKDADATAAVQGQQAVVQAATVAANAATQAWKDAIGNRTKEDNTATARAIQNAADVQGKVTQGYDLQVKQIADISDKQLKQHTTRMTQLLSENGALGPAGTPTGVAAAAAAAGNAGVIAGAVSQPSVTLQQAIADATKVAPQAMHDYGVLMANLLAAGLAQGLSEQGAITYALSTLSKGMQGQISQDWQMHSPSKVAESYGRNIVAGLVGGIRASQADAHAVLGGLFGGPGGGNAGGSVGAVHVTVNVSGDAVSVSGADHHGLAKALGEHARDFLAAVKTTTPPAGRLLPGAQRALSGT